MVLTENVNVNREQSYSENFVDFIDKHKSYLNNSLKQKQINSSKICCCLLHNRKEDYDKS